MPSVTSTSASTSRVPSGMAGSHRPPSHAMATAPPTNPPIAPSTVFFGLIAGASSVRPNKRPA